MINILSFLLLSHFGLAATPTAVELKSSVPPTVVVFLSAKCPCSIGHEEALKKLADEFAAKGVRFFGVHSNANEDRALSQKHFKEASLPFPVIDDKNGAIAAAFEAIKTPHAYIIKNGKILYRGGVDNSRSSSDADKHYLRDALIAVEKNQDPPLKETRVLGCIITRE